MGQLEARSSLNSSLILSPARIRVEKGQPRSLDYGDIFFARDGRNESHRVFIEPMRLEAMFRESSHASVSIGELGFGTGLNFLAVCEAFVNSAPQCACLDYIAFEKHPLARSDLARIANSHTPPLALADELIACWPHLLRGWHSRHLANGRIRLLLYLGDAHEGLLDFTGRCRAWLLDGFDPGCNPEMWHQALLQQVAGHSEPGARLATFTARGALRRQLESVGFQMWRVDQRPHKRHSLAGVLRNEASSVSRQISEVCIVGAGFAGVFTAHLLALRGIEVHLFDMRRAPMPIALAHARLGDPAHPLMQLRALARGYSNDWYRRLGAPAGILEAPFKAKDIRRMERSAETWRLADDSICLLGPAESRERTNFSAIERSLWHAQCHLVSHEILEPLLNHARITLHPAEVVSCTAEGRYWKVGLRQAASQHFERLIICAGAGSRRLLPNLNLRSVAGQIEIAKSTHPQPAPLVGHGFAVPLQGNHVAFGSTYEQRSLTGREATTENFERTEQWFNALGTDFNPNHQSTWRGQRAYHQDRMPIAGELAAGLFVNTAHGSAGSLLAPLCADLVASLVSGTPLPLTQALARTIRTTR